MVQFNYAYAQCDKRFDLRKICLDLASEKAHTTEYQYNSYDYSSTQKNEASKVSNKYDGISSEPV